MRSLVAILALVLVLATPALAQLPPVAAPAPAVSIAIDEETGTVSLDRVARFGVTVKNEGAPLPQGNEATASDVVLSVSGAPEGWTVTVIPSSMELMNGQSSTGVELQVSVSGSATAMTADLVVMAELYSPAEGLEPLLGQIPQGTQKATATDTLQVTVDNSVTRNVLETIGPWIYAILLLLVAAVLVAVGMSLAARRALVRMSSPTREQAIAPGGRAVFPFQAEGLSKREDVVLLQVSEVQPGWAAFLPTPELVLDPGQVQELTLIVIAPADAPAGARQAVLVSATSARAPKGVANLEFVATVQGAAPSAPRRPKA